MSWMSPFTVPITTLPTRSTPVSASSGRRISIPAFIAFAASSTSGTNRMPSRKSMPTMRIPSTSASFSTRSAAQPAPSRMFVPSDDLVGQPVVEVVVHLRDELVVGRAMRGRSLSSAHLGRSYALSRSPLGSQSGSLRTVAGWRTPKYSTSTGVPSAASVGRR